MPVRPATIRNECHLSAAGDPLGPKDNFDLNGSHVIPARIRASAWRPAPPERARSSLWGDGTLTREFLYATDAAKGIVLATQKYDKPGACELWEAAERSRSRIWPS